MKKVKIMISLMLGIAFAMSILGCEEAGTEVAAGINFEIPAPTDLRIAVNSTNSVAVTWTELSNARYDMRYTISGGIQELETSADGDGQEIAGLKSGDTVQVWVRAVSVYKEGSDATKTVKMEKMGDVTGVTFVGNTATTITVKWNEVVNVGSYIVSYFLKDATEETADEIYTDDHTGTTIENLLPNKEYNIKVTAVNGFGISKSSDALSPAPKTAEMGFPVIVFDSSYKTIDINWNEVEGATHYNLYWGESADLAILKATVKAGNETSYLIEGLKENKLYQVLVEAENEFTAERKRTVKSVTTGPPEPTIVEAPTGLRVTSAATAITVNWNSVATATAYNIYYSTQIVKGENYNKYFAPSPKYKKGSVSENVSTYKLTGLNPGEFYYVYVTAVKGTEESNFAERVSTTILDKPTGLIVTKTDDGKVTITWDPVDGPDVEYSFGFGQSINAPNYGWQNIETSWSDNKLVYIASEGSSYYFIRAYKNVYDADGRDTGNDITSEAAVSARVTYP